jgi:hypothetical protein
MGQDERIQELQEQLMRMSEGKMKSFGLDNLPPDIAEEFLKRVVTFEEAAARTNVDQDTRDPLDDHNRDRPRDEER